MGISFWQIAIVVVIVVLLFGRGKISSLMGDVAKGIKSFKRGMSDDSSNTDDNKTNSDNSDPKIIKMLKLVVRDFSSCYNCYRSFRPEEFPIALKKIGSYIGKLKNTFSSFQREISSVSNEIDLEKNITKDDDLKEKNKIDD